ncbi:uncharacterized protein LOC143919775 [Arctopsyche grandis]|uniref:uncharacterized protein LOC143919775 n=1 Tax=Arctopsyche grandis TaxID=121162 RepID=UPI00406D6A2E
MTDFINLNIETVEFIRAIKERRPLWDSACPDYVRIDKKRQCWLEVINVFKSEEYSKRERNHFGSLLQKKWKNLRGSYTRELAKKGEPGDRKSTYLYFEELSFLRNVVTVKGIENIASFRSPLEKFKSQKRLAEFGESSHPSKIQSVSTIPNASVLDDEILTVLNKSIRLREEREYQMEQDSERMFLLSLVSFLKMVPEEKKLDLKIEIMDVIKRSINPRQAPCLTFLPEAQDTQSALETSNTHTRSASTSFLPKNFSIKSEPELMIENSSQSSDNYTYSSD